MLFGPYPKTYETSLLFKTRGYAKENTGSAEVAAAAVAEAEQSNHTAKLHTMRQWNLYDKRRR